MHRAEEDKITPQELIAELPKGLVKWYPFEADQCALYITGNTELDRAVEEALRESGMTVDCVEAAGLRGSGMTADCVEAAGLRESGMAADCVEANMAAGGSGQENIVLKRYDHIIITTAIEQTGNREEAAAKSKDAVKGTWQAVTGDEQSSGHPVFLRGQRSLYGAEF